MTHALQSIREQARLTVAELAMLSGLNASTIYNIERGSPFGIHETTATTLAHILQRSVSEIFQEGELSHRGRPAFTTNQEKPTKRHSGKTCPHCYLELPLTLNCSDCGYSANSSTNYGNQQARAETTI